MKVSVMEQTELSPNWESLSREWVPYRRWGHGKVPATMLVRKCETTGAVTT